MDYTDSFAEPYLKLKYNNVQNKMDNTIQNYFTQSDVLQKMSYS